LEGNLPHFASVKVDEMEAYNEAPIIFPTAVPAPDPSKAYCSCKDDVGRLGVIMLATTMSLLS
jgi:hypothetical protein